MTTNGGGDADDDNEEGGKDIIDVFGDYQVTRRSCQAGQTNALTTRLP